MNEVLARRLSPDRPAVGMTIAAAGRSLTIVGVVRDSQYYVSGDAPRPQVFAFSVTQRTREIGVRVAIGVIVIGLSVGRAACPRAALLACRH